MSCHGSNAWSGRLPVYLLLIVTLSPLAACQASPPPEHEQAAAPAASTPASAPSLSQEDRLALAGWVADLDATSVLVRRRAVRQLAQAGPPARKALEKAAGHDDTQVRRIALQALGQWSDQGVLDLLGQGMFITIPPDVLRQSTWLMLAQPVKGVMYHSMHALLPEAVHGAKGTKYVMTNPDSAEVMREVNRRLIQPLGPALRHIPDAPRDVAFLESFTTQMFTASSHGASYGWANGWSADAYLTLLWAHLTPQVIFEETIMAHGLDRYKVLVLADCTVLPASVVQAIKAWQDKGGIVVADQRLVPALQADILLPVHHRKHHAQTDKAAFQKLAQTLRQELAGHYQPHAEASHPDLYVRPRLWKESEYLFVVNDHRTYGDYIGHHGRVMEKGVPLAGEVRLTRDHGVVYDLLASRLVQTARQDGRLTWPVQLQAGDGGLFLITPQAIDAVQLEGPATAQAGGQATWQVRVVDDD